MDELKGKRIFIFEDNQTNVAVFSAILKQSGATVIQQAWKNDSIAQVQTHLPVDIILLDLMLGAGISGYDIFDRLKAQPELMLIPVVAVSASDPGIEIPRVKARGFAGFICKPIHLQEFPKQIVACIQGQQVWVAG